MTDARSPLGAWRLTVRRLGDQPGDAEGEVDVLTRLEAGGALTVVVAGRDHDPGSGDWRAAGPGRLILVARWFVPPGRGGRRLVVRAAAELSDDGRRCTARLVGQHVDAVGRPLPPVVSGEASGQRVQP